MPSARPTSLFKAAFLLVKEAGQAWVDDYAPSMGAALAYYTLFSIAPVLLIVITIAGAVFGEEAARGQIFTQLRDLMGEQGATAIEGLLQSVGTHGKGLLGTAIGVAVLLVGSTTVFGELQDALDRIWRAPARDKTGGLWGLIRARLLSFGMVLAIGFLLMVSLVMNAVLAAWGTRWGKWFEGMEALGHVVDFIFSFGFTTVAFALIYKIMPRVHIRWHDVWIGAALTALLFGIGKLLIGLYIGKSGVVSGFGAASSIVVLLVWVYYSAQIFLMGAEMTWVYAHLYGSRRGQRRPGAAGTAAEDATRSAPPSAPPRASSDLAEKRRPGALGIG